jgi:pimeloyl-ACP methyl ester carboxylesterase/class 3 adenylate cyclase
MPPPIRFARSGDLNIAYEVVGSAPVDLVWVSGTASHLDLYWEQPRYVRMFERIATFARLILFDKRGSGLSDRPDHLASLDERTDDVRAVMDATGSENAHILGTSEGGSIAMLFAATYPRRTASLILHGTLPRWSWAPDWPWGETEEDHERVWRERAERGHLEDFTAPNWRRWLGEMATDPSYVEWFDRFRRAGGTPAARKAISDMNRLIDVRPLLSAISARTLVVVREDDPVAPLEAVRAYVPMIPRARLLVLPGQGHAMGGVMDALTSAIEEAVTGSSSPAPNDRLLATIAFADIVGSTELIARIGDEAWKDVLERHYQLATQRLTAYGGVEVDRAGDGLLARFEGPARAISWARSLLSEDRAMGLAARAGIHTGEVELVGSTVRGIAVHIASRISVLAAPGEVLVSSTVRDLVAGSGIAFVDRGVHALKGVPETKQVFAVA